MCVCNCFKSESECMCVTVYIYIYINIILFVFVWMDGWMDKTSHEYRDEQMRVRPLMFERDKL